MSDLRATRLAKADSLHNLGHEPYAVNFQPNHKTAQLQTDYADLPNGEEREVDISVAGRILTRRVMGKLAFFTLLDESGSIQLFLEKALINSWRGVKQRSTF